MRLFLLAALCVSAYAQTPQGLVPLPSLYIVPDSPSARWHWSVLALASATALDLHSSRDLYELNPVLGRGSFGARQATIKVSLAAGLIGAEYLVIRRWPSTERAWRWVNWFAAGTTTAVAVRNYRQ